MNEKNEKEKIKADVKVKPENKCARCGKHTIDFIWTSSRNVNNGIRAMYRNSKICRKCYDDMCKIYPPVERHNKKTDKEKTYPMSSRYIKPAWAHFHDKE